MEILSALGLWGVLIAAAVIVILVVKLIGCAVMPFISNIIAGGALYWLLDAVSIVKMHWSVTDALIIAVFGVPGTVVLALYRFFAA